MVERPKAKLLALGVAALVAFVLLITARQITLRHWYSANGAYRAQVAAMLAGRLALSNAPEVLAHDYAWTDDGVQQVWGLGIPMWQTPFERGGRLVGLSPFPDRIPLVFWLALMLYVAMRGL